MRSGPEQGETWAEYRKRKVVSGDEVRVNSTGQAGNVLHGNAGVALVLLDDGSLGEFPIDELTKAARP